MRRTLFASAGLFAIACGAFVFAHFQSRADAQQPAVDLADPDIVFAENPELAAAEKAAYESTAIVAIEEAAEAEARPLATIRDKYLELLRRKAELMTDEQINEAMQQITTDIGELEAGRRLEEITAELRELIETYPESTSARRAQAMLATPDQGAAYYGAPTYPSPGGGDAPYYNGPARPTPVPAKPRSDGEFQPIPSRPLEPTPTPASGDFRPQ